MNFKEAFARLKSPPGPDATEPVPLIPEPEAPTPYPMASLGSLRAPAEAIARAVQVPDAIAAQAVLAAASLATQAYANVEMPYGGRSPMSLFLMSICESGDRKTSTDAIASGGIKNFENDLRRVYAEEYEVWTAANSAWSTIRKGIESAGKKLSTDELRNQLEEHGPAPLAPLAPVASVSDVTLEGLVQFWADARPSLGLFTSEGGMIVGGHAMSDDAKLRSAAILSQLWDGESIRRLRAADGQTFLYGRRLSMHIMIQPDAARGFLGDPTLRDQGLLARFLAAAPATLKGSRLYREPEKGDLTEIAGFNERIYDLLTGQPAVPGPRHEGLKPRPMGMSPEARDVWIWLHDEIEKEQGPGGALHRIAPLASKIPEHAARIAGVLTIFQDPSSQEIAGAAMESAVGLVNYYIAEALRLSQEHSVQPEILEAEALRKWILERDGGEILFRDIMRKGPRATRPKEHADRAVAILRGHGWLTPSLHKMGVYMIRRPGEGIFDDDDLAAA